MAKHFHRKPRPVNIENSGFGPNSAVEGGRLTNKDGTVNLRKTGLPVWQRTSIYHSLLRMSRIKFLLFVVLFYSTVNFIFAGLYFLVGVNNLSGTEAAKTYTDKFLEAFFFSAQTLTTVGYGRVAPVGVLANFVAATESLLGILIFAVVTGMMYGRFSRPRAYIIFSQNILVAPYKHGKALMFRLATYKNNHLTDSEAIATIALHVWENDKEVTRFYPLKLEISKINSLALSWTVVHAIDDESPIYGFTAEDIIESKAEVIINVKSFDDHFSNVVQQRTSYTVNEVVYGARFLPMFHKAENADHTILELDKINAYENVIFPEHHVNPSDSNAVTANA
ncbi:MAG TPA: ion channel [Flavipsychrobacter sp.]|nr:ion channel [Flavipsychrobacter sp.]